MVDISIYNTVRIFRYPFSAHPKSKGYFKTLLKYVGFNKENPSKSFVGMNPDKVSIMRDIFTGYDGGLSGIYADITKTKIADERVLTSIGQTSGNSADYHAYTHRDKICMKRMMNLKSCTGQRNIIAIRLVAHWREDLGLNKAATEALLRTWVAQLDNQKDVAKLIRNAMIGYDKGYKFTCKDVLKAKFCSQQCFYYKMHVAGKSQEVVCDASEMVTELHQVITASHDNSIILDKIWGGMDCELIPSYGQVMVIVAYSSVGKTTILLNILNAVKHVNFLIFSYDDSSANLTRKLMALNGLDPMVPADREEYKRLCGHIYVEKDPLVCIEDVENRTQVLEDKYGVTFDYLCFDYIQLIPVKGGGGGATEKINKVVQKVKVISKKQGREKGIILLSQTQMHNG